ncbi:MAG: DegT/DnrJ/EryC1/StrS family aminotransferase [Aquisalimonadaceae bacterium]
MIPMVDLKAQYDDIRAEIEQGLAQVLDTAQFILGPNVQAFEQEAADYLGVSHAVSCASGTDALHLALAASGVGPGDEVITSPFTFIATAEAICYVGATPVFVDIEPDTFNLDPDQVAAAITSRTRAILPVHLFGQPADIFRLQQLADQHKLLLIEDCAQSWGASRDGVQSGAVGVSGCYSFFPSKNLGCYGDGGMVGTNSEQLAEELRVLRNHGSRERYHHHLIGYNSRLDEMQAVILRAKLKRIDRYNEGRRRAAHAYSAALKDVPGITTPYEDPRGYHVYHQYTLLVDDRDTVMDALRARNIGCAVYYPIPLHRQEVFQQQFADVNLPIAEKTARHCLSLPMFPELTEQQIDEVVTTIRETLGRH